MEKKEKKSSGLDFEALNAKMNALDQKAEKEKDVQQETVNLQELTEELKLVIGDVRHLVPKVRELSVSVERAGQQLEKAGKEGDLTYTLFKCAIINSTGFLVVLRNLHVLFYNNNPCDCIPDLRSSTLLVFVYIWLAPARLERCAGAF